MGFELTSKVTVSIDEKAIKNKINGLLTDDVKLEINNFLVEVFNPYTPMDTGFLSQSAQAFPEYISYTGPYAHYMYIGQVYGPNIPKRDAQGNIIGWFSPPEKYPTGLPINYNTEKHPLATAKWDKVAMANSREMIEEHIQKIIEREANK